MRVRQLRKLQILFSDMLFLVKDNCFVFLNVQTNEKKKKER